MSKTIDVFCPTCGHMEEVPRNPLPGERRPPGCYWARYADSEWEVARVTHSEIWPDCIYVYLVDEQGVLLDEDADRLIWGPRIEPPSEAKL